MHNALEAMTAEKRQFLLKNASNEERWVVLDNIQTYARRWDPRIGTANRMVTGTGSTAVVMQECPPGAFDVKSYFAKLAEYDRKNLTVVKILEDVDMKHLNLVSELHWLNILVQYVPSLACYRKRVAEIFKSTAAKHPIKPTRKTQVHLLGTNSANEVTATGMKEALTDIFEQLGVTEKVLETKL